MERAIKRMNVEGKRDHMLIKLHPDVAMYLLEQERGVHDVCSICPSRTEDGVELGPQQHSI